MRRVSARLQLYTPMRMYAYMCMHTCTSTRARSTREDRATLSSAGVRGPGGA